MDLGKGYNTLDLNCANYHVLNADKTVIYWLAHDRLFNILSTVRKHHHQYLCQGPYFILRQARGVSTSL